MNPQGGRPAGLGNEGAGIRPTWSGGIGKTGRTR